MTGRGQVDEISHLGIVDDIRRSDSLRGRVDVGARLAGRLLSEDQLDEWLWEAAMRPEWGRVWTNARRARLSDPGWRGDVITDQMINDFVLETVRVENGLGSLAGEP